MNCRVGFQHFTDRISLAWAQRYAPAMFGKRGRCVVCGDEPQGISNPTEDIAEVGITDACGLLQHCGEYGLKVARRAAYNLKDFGGSSLLLQRLAQVVGALAQVVEQSRIL